MENYFLFSTRTALLVTLCFVLFFSCEEPEEAVTPATVSTGGDITNEVKEQFLSLGFDPRDLVISDGNYLVEGDIIITPETLDHLLSSTTVTDGPQGEQFRTNLVVASSYKTIKVAIATLDRNTIRPNTRLDKALDRAVANYNSLGLRFKLKKVSALITPADVNIHLVSGTNRLGGGDFPYIEIINYGSLPTIAVRPGKRIEIDRSAFNGTDNFLEHVVTHELGHTLGMRHTDWYNRDLSCAGGGNEGTGSSGAVHIPGTPAQTSRPPDPSSIMNACIPGGSSGEFSRYDKVAWRWVY